MSWFSFHFIFWAISCLYCHQLYAAGNNETDRLALLEFKARITRDPLGIMSSWNDTLHFCEWFGVTCGRKHRRVTRLDFNSSKLTGTLSPHIGNLTFLRELYLQHNKFSGPIPHEISHLRRLEYLFLFDNAFDGEIPSNISACHSLIELSLGYNNLVGGIPPDLGSLRHLEFLALNFVNLVGVIPSFFGNISSLEGLSIFGTNLVGKIPDVLGNLDKLTMLELGMNKLSGEIPHSLGKLRKMETLYLGGNKLSGEVPPSIFNLSSMTEFDIQQNQLKGSLPSGLGFMLPNIQYLALNDNQFTGYIPASISNASNLEILQLGGNYLHGQVPSFQNLRKLKKVFLHENLLGNGQTSDLDFVYSLSNSTMLDDFEIYENNFTGKFPHIICNFTRLTDFEIRNNKISGQIPACIGNLANLVMADVSHCQLSGVIPESIGDLKNLHYLYVSNNQLSGHLPASIGNLTQVSRIDLSRNNLQGQIPSTIESCKTLEALRLSYNNLSGRIPSRLLTLSSISIVLDLSHNQLVGPLPTEVGTLVHLTALDISQNMISGEIPSTLGACVSLEILNMSGNFFQGTIPSMLNALAGLQELNLSHNNLSGKIPDFLVKFQLRKLDLSNNSFEGEVPIGGIFRNATGLSLSGNNRLCGGIPKLKLPQCRFSKTQKRRLSHRMRLIAAILSVLAVVILLVAFASLYSLYSKKRRKKLRTLGSQVSGNALSNASYQSLLKATNGFASENLLGSGTFGVVYKGIFDEGTIVAIKKFNLEHKRATKSFMAECEILRNIRHRNLVQVITACSGIDYQGNDFKALVYEHMVNGSLEDWLHSCRHRSVDGTSYAPKNLNFLQRLDIAIDVAFALEYLHHGFGAPIVHCDLKPSNVLLDDEMVAHVGDFGLAKFLPEGISVSYANESSSVGVRGTVGYTPPEYGLGNEVSKCGDIYSFGILLLEMFTAKKPTDDMFKGSLSLHNFVKEAMPERVPEVLDSALVKDMVEHGIITLDRHRETRNTRIVLVALISVLEIALACSVEVPHERLDMKYVAARLSSVRSKLARIGLRL